MLVVEGSVHGCVFKKLQGIVPKENVYIFLQARGNGVWNVHTCVVGDSKFYKSVSSNDLY
jgi:hypothetical protein